MKADKRPWVIGGAIEFRTSNRGRPYDFAHRDPPSVHEMSLVPAGEGLSLLMSKIASGLSA